MGALLENTQTRKHARSKKTQIVFQTQIDCVGAPLSLCHQTQSTELFTNFLTKLMSLFNFFRKRSLSAADEQPQGETGANKREGQTANNMVREVWLQYREGNSDKVYHLMLRREMDGLYTVNFEFGRRGAALQSGTKTDQNVALEAAEKIFNTLEKEKTKKIVLGRFAPQLYFVGLKTFADRISKPV